ncbi:MAG TPA: 4-(cytidine 5'-diphospho)-2-C-methyl-D-erythritol kinase [Moraxellaceae bacterium]|nr:4-(cytidine 5'-diphospho)-2-C-methyl-D-erythritol kinase [Moraxellaceae bacterium]
MHRPSELTLPAPAKLNLFLHITGRRTDGYHLLQTVFQFIDRCDSLHFAVREDGIVSLTPELAGVPAESNLVVKAARLLQRATGCALGANITLTKILPMGGGIGGGSSDAATTLLALDRLWHLDLGEDRLAALGLELGADVPVFVRGRAAFAEGVGEHLTPVDLPEPWYLVLTPDAHISTVDVFRHPQLTRHTPAITLAAFRAGDPETGLRNDCEAVVRMLSPAVAAALDWLSQYGPARMTGTGACCFLPCPDRARAEALLAQSPIQGFVARGMNRSSAHVALDAPA